MKELTLKDIHSACIQGANQVVSNRQTLNRINVFPVEDGDTGSNLASMMRTIQRESKVGSSLKSTLSSISDAALQGARGNSGIIFAQYLSGFSMAVGDAAVLTPSLFAKASRQAASSAYAAVENPVEGTIITVMRTWGQAVSEALENSGELMPAINRAYESLEEALRQTQYQLKDLKKAGVVDSGAKGFTFFVKGIVDYYRGDRHVDTVEEAYFEFEEEALHNHKDTITHRYCTEGFLEGEGMDLDAIRKALRDLGDSMVVAGSDRRCRIHIHSDEPTKVFEALYPHGNIVFQKADDMVKQQAIVNDRRANIALVTDSIADLPMDFVDEHQIHMMHLSILFRDMTFLDKLTIAPATLLEYSRHDRKLPTSSQPDPKQIEHLISYLKTYYDSVIILTVSSALSGTFSNVNKTLEAMNLDGFKVSVIDTKQNSAAQGLLVKKAAQMITGGADHDSVVKAVASAVPKSKILVRVKTLDNMIKSGRLSTRAGKIGKVIGLNPIVTLNAQGEGALEGVAFSVDGSLKKLLTHVKQVHKKSEIDHYAIVHINNPEEATAFEEKFTQLIGKAPDYVTETSSIVAVGAGEGAVAISYILK